MPFISFPVTIRVVYQNCNEPVFTIHARTEWRMNHKFWATVNYSKIYYFFHFASCKLWFRSSSSYRNVFRYSWCGIIRLFVSHPHFILNVKCDAWDRKRFHSLCASIRSVVYAHMYGHIHSICVCKSVTSCWFVDHFVIPSQCQIYQCFPSERRQSGMIDSVLLLFWIKVRCEVWLLRNT